MVFTWIFAAILSTSALATTQITSRIYDIDYSNNPREDILVLLESGNVLKIPNEKSLLLLELQNLHSNQEAASFTYNKKRDIIEVEVASEVASSELSEKSLHLFAPLHDPSYVPTTIPSMEEAKRLHKQSRLYQKDSQCFNRAMVWSYEWWKKNSVKSMKVLIYFTRSYIRRHNFEWWFHIAPYLHVKDGDKVVERVMDIKYTSGPRSFKQWTDIFMSKDPECPIISKFSEYADNPYIGDCYLQRTTMFTLQPADLQMHEAWGYTKTSFLMREVAASYLEAFDEVLKR